jgi:hypothetical protein
VNAGYARTSGDEADTGQDVVAQAAQLERDVPGIRVFVDDGVSGSVPLLERPGLHSAVEFLEAAGGGTLWARDMKRLGRRHPADMARELDEIARRGIVVRFTNDMDPPCLVLAEQTPVQAGMFFFQTFGPWSELVTGRATTQRIMDDFKNNVRQTKSGKPVGRPQKVSEDEARRWYPVAVEKGSMEAARLLSVEKGWRPDMDPRTAKKYRVGHSTLIGVFKRLELPWPCVKNPVASETVSDVQGEDCDGNGAVSDGGQD